MIMDRKSYHSVVIVVLWTELDPGRGDLNKEMK